MNKITSKDVYPLSRTDDASDSFSGARLDSTMDLMSDYWQIEVDERDREKTAFIIPDGLCYVTTQQHSTSEAVPGGGIRITNNRVWWFPRMASTFTRSDSNRLFPVAIPQTAGVCDPSETLQDRQRRIVDACANVTHTMLHRVQREVQARLQMCIVADGEKFEHRK
ncbi:hypothetical protein AVEN_217458-1 [Araneus ventricosus]|uniref:Uncharacterized protein n=1 Tax=Araneus ventricosus TaxID=182803 RepID=A0A4Y2JLR7_ARAVE|nr:hypothetical protein AVEN_217458-1 [Araneus ventricosus]